MNFANVTNIRIPQGEIIQIQDSLSRVLWRKSSPTPSYSTPFYVEDMSGSENTLSIVKSGMYTSNAPTLTIEMSRDGVSWSTLGTTSDVALIASIPANSKLYLRCSTSGWGNQYNATAAYNAIDCSGSYGVGGNVMSLIYGDSFTGNEVDFKSLATYRLVFVNLFSGSINLVESSSLILPATTLVIAGAGPGWEPTDVTMWGCYGQMFLGCTSLISAPALPATTLAKRCYNGMFKGCTSLVSTPALPATALEESCYSNMFSGCASLATAPALSATILEESCYNSMFNGCTAMNNITCLATDISAFGCLYIWVDGVSQTGTFTKKAGVTWPTGSDGIPEGWTVVEV